MQEKSSKPLQGVGMADVKMKNAFLDWLVNGDAKKTAPPSSPTPADAATAQVATAPSLYLNSSGDDFEEFRLPLCQPKRPFRKPGITVKEEYELWLADRAKTRAAATSATQTA
jgi:hypothetical protein